MKNRYLQKSFNFLFLFMLFTQLVKAQTLQLLNLTGGETISGCSIQKIMWKGEWLGPTVRLEFSQDAGASWILINEVNTATGTNSYDWAVPNMNSGKIRVRVFQQYFSTVLTDYSKSNITITPSGSKSATLLYPKGGEHIAANSLQTIRWSTKGVAGNISLRYSSDGGLTWNFVRSLDGKDADNIPNTGAYKWIVPAYSNQLEYGIVQVYASADPCVTDYNDSFFKIDQHEALTIWYPSEGDSLYVGNTQTIYCIRANVANENINTHYSVDNGKTWILLDSNSVNPYNWLIPDKVTSTGRLRISLTSDNSIKDSISFKILKPFIKILKPASAETFNSCNATKITWLQKGVLNKSKLDYSINGGNSWVNIDSVIVSKDSNEYNWAVPNNASTNARIRIRNAENSKVADSTAAFTITADASRSLTITSPNGGESFPPSSWQTVTWTSNGTVGNVTLQYSLNGGLKWELMVGEQLYYAKDIPNTGTFKWLVPDGLSPNSKLLIRIYEESKPCISDYSNAFFSINNKPSIAIQNPLTNEEVYSTNEYDIWWRGSNLPTDRANVQYSINNGTTWIMLDSNSYMSFSSLGHFKWIVPSSYTTQGVIRVSATADPSIYSEVHFKIVAPYISITSPAGGNTVTGGCYADTIKWVQHGTSYYSSLDYSIDEGKTWISFGFAVNSLPGSNHYVWYKPNSDITTYRIRVRDAYNAAIKDSSKTNIIIVKDTATVYVEFKYPNGGESFSLGSIQHIQWTQKKSYMGGAKLYYTTDGGLNWVIANDPAGNIFTGIDTSFNWQIPATIPASSNCLLRIFDNECVVDYTNRYFTISDAPAINITNPATNDSLFTGRIYPLKWTTHKTPGDTVLIDYSLDNGANWTVSSSGYFDTAYSYNWTAPSQVTAQGILRIRVKADPSISNTINFKTAKASIKLLAPYVTEFNACENTGITWSGVGLSDFVALDYSTDEGQTWKPIERSYYRKPHDTYLWSVNNDASDKVRIRVRDAANSSVRDSSKVNLKITSYTAEAFTLTSPNGGELFSPNDAITVTWATKESIPSVTLEYSTDAGSTWNLMRGITNSTSANISNTGSFFWLLPDNLPASSSCLVRIYIPGRKCIMDVSDSFFSLDRKPNIGIFSPIENAVLYRNQTAFISWRNFQLPKHDSVDIFYSLTNGASWIQIDSNYKYQGYNYEWIVPNQLNNQGILKIQASGNPAIYDQVHFTITTPSILLARPNGGEQFTGCKKGKIAWFNNGAAGYAVLDYSFDDGVKWIRFDSVPQVADSNYYNYWEIPNMESNKVRIRVSNGSYPLANDFSDKSFSILSNTATTLTITSPNGGESFPAGSGQTVTWVKKGSPVDRVGIAYSLDGGAHWEDALDGSGLPASNIANTGTFQWAVPRVKGIFPKCLLQIIDPFTPCIRDYSDGFFNIDSIPSITISNPKEGDTLYATKDYSISWIARNVPYDYVSIDYSLDNGVTWVSIQKNYQFSTINWRPPFVFTNQGVIRVSATADPSLKSEIHFVTGPASITLLSPVGGETFNGCSNATITWKQKGIRAVLVDYSFDAGLTWIFQDYIPHSADGSYSYDWSVPNVASDKLRVRLREASAAVIRDSSKVNATILADATTATLELTYPNGGEVFSSSTIHPITWTSKGNTGNVSIQFSKDGGYWDFIFDKNQKTADNIPNNGKFEWLVPTRMEESSHYKFRIFETPKPCNIDYSNADSEIKNIPVITVISPQENTTWYVGRWYEIKWVSEKLPTEYVNVDYSYDNGATWVNVVTNYIAYSSFFKWYIPNTPGDQCILRVSATADSSLNASVPFKISSGSNHISLQTPVGGEVLTGCSTKKISWTYTDSLDAVNLDYSLDGGKNWIPLDYGAYKDASKAYDWKVPNITSNDAKIRVSNYYDKLTSDSSKTTFHIVKDTSFYLTLTSPNGGESFPAGSLQLIEWKSKGNIPKVTLEYSIDGGATWMYVIDGLNVFANNIDNLNSCYWLVPANLPLASKCLMRIYKPWTASSCELDYSDAFFSINHDPTIAITQPRPNETRYAGLSYPIKWEKANLSSSVVNIDYSTDNGTTWSLIDSSNANNYDWVIPNTISDKSVIRVRSKADNTVKSLVNFKIAGTVNIQENQDEKGNWIIYPNPTSDVIHLDYTADQQMFIFIKVMDMKGQLIFQESHVNYKGRFMQTVNLNPEKPGMYLLQIITDKGIVSKKIIKN